uniref:Secreted protein n=1 Tax=Kalanchoe fedtschenkoi TaxID=63787 RepID=A0A7N1A9S6_KALFE
MFFWGFLISVSFSACNPCRFRGTCCFSFFSSFAPPFSFCRGCRDWAFFVVEDFFFCAAFSGYIETGA